MAYYTNSIVNSSVMEGIVASLIIVCLLSSMSSGHYTNIKFNEDFRIPRNCILQLPRRNAIYQNSRGYRGGSPTAVQAWRPCPLWEPSP